SKRDWSSDVCSSDLLSAIFGITSDQDDDGNQSSGNGKPDNQTNINEELTTEFSKALQKVGGKDKLYEQLETDKESMNKLIKSKDNKKKQAMINQLRKLA